MGSVHGAFPILPGKEQKAGNFAAACMGERRKGFERAAGHVETDSGDLGSGRRPRWGASCWLWFEAPDVEKAFTDLATAGNEFTTWFLGQVKDVTGVDLSAPPASPTPEVLVDWTA